MHLRFIRARHDFCGKWRISFATWRHAVDAAGRKARYAQHGKRTAVAALFFPGGGYYGGHTGTWCFVSEQRQNSVSCDVLCLRPEEDFQRADSMPPASLQVTYRAPTDPDVPQLMKEARALVIPAVGPKLPPTLFEGASVRFVQVTGAGLDRLDLAHLRALGIVAANVPGGSNAAVAEYVVTTASLLL